MHTYAHTKTGQEKLKKEEVIESTCKYIHGFLDKRPWDQWLQRTTLFPSTTHYTVTLVPKHTLWRCEVVFTERKTYHLRDHINNPFYEVSSKLTSHTVENSLVGLDDQNWLFDVFNFKKSNTSCVWQIQQKGGLSAGVLFGFWLEWLSHQHLISVSRTLSVFSDFLLWPSRNIADSRGYSPLYLWGTLKRLC